MFNMNMNMNMNPMMGNMNPMGMNNQLMTNFAMDDTAMKLKAIIEPYEKKITELEQIIKQKDFEILVLNQKLSEYRNNPMMMNNNINMMNPMMNNNINMMNPMMMDNNMNWRDLYNNMGNNNNINLPLNNMNNKVNLPKLDMFIACEGKRYLEQLYMDENIGKFFKRFCRKIGIKFKNCKFIYNAKSLPSTLTFAELGIDDRSQIFVEVYESNYSKDEESEDDDQCECEGLKHNISFRTTRGNVTNISISGEHSLATLLKKYMARTRISEEIANKKINFIYNSKIINFDRVTKIKDFFKGDIYIPKGIIVNDISGLIGV